MKLGTMRIPCVDLKESEAFYSNKLGLNKIFGSTEEGFVGYQLDNVQLMIEPQETGEFECGRFLGFSLETKNIAKSYETLRSNGVRFTGPPEKQTWGGTMTHIIDCSGNSFSLVES